MKKLRELQGGYPRQQDYLLSLQNELLTVADSLFAKLGVDMVLKGCEVTDNGNGTVNIAAGIVFVGGEVIRFDGASNVVANGTKTFIKDAAVNTDPRVFADGQTKQVYTEVKAIVGDKSNVAQVAIGLTLYNLSNYIQDVVSNYALKGELKDVYDLDGDFLDNFDEDGLGITARFSGWRLFNEGQGRTKVTVGRLVSDGVEYNYTHGDVGGAVTHRLTVSEIPAHAHTMPQQITIATAGEARSDAFNRVNSNYTTRNTQNTGGGQAHNNMQPHINVYTIIKYI